jgi:hypothetical protein
VAASHLGRLAPRRAGRARGGAGLSGVVPELERWAEGYAMSAEGGGLRGAVAAARCQGLRRAAAVRDGQVTLRHLNVDISRQGQGSITGF